MSDPLAIVRDALLDSRGWHVNNPTRAQLAACERDAHNVLTALGKHDASLGVGGVRDAQSAVSDSSATVGERGTHIWSAVSCPAYRTLDGADCTCSGGGA